MLNKDELLLVEGIKNMLKHDERLGLSMHDDDTETHKLEHGSQYLHEQINDMFEVKTAHLTHSDSVCRAFRKVHTYKYIDDFSFIPAMLKEMAATAVPVLERDRAISVIPRIISELYTEQNNWSERDAGFNPALDEVMELSRPEQPLDFKIHKRGLNKRNVDKPKKGDSSPARVDSRPPLPADSHEIDE